MEQQAYFGSIAPQIRTMFTAQFENLKEDLIHKKVSYTYRFFLITEGSCTVCFDNYQRLCSKGDIFFLCPHQNYSTTFHPASFKCMNTVFEFSGDPARKPGASEPLSRILYYSNLKPAPELYAEKESHLRVHSRRLLISSQLHKSHRARLYRLFAARLHNEPEDSGGHPYAAGQRSDHHRHRIPVVLLRQQPFQQGLSGSYRNQALRRPAQLQKSGSELKSEPLFSYLRIISQILLTHIFHEKIPVEEGRNR